MRALNVILIIREKLIFFPFVSAANDTFDFFRSSGQLAAFFIRQFITTYIVAIAIINLAVPPAIFI
jgi:hypothetical protein